MEIIKELDIKEDHLYSLEMHAFINIITLMYNHLFLMQEESGDSDLFNDSMELAYNLAYGVKTKDRTCFNPGKIRAYKKEITLLFEKLETKKSELKKSKDFIETKRFFYDVIQVMDERLNDLLIRWANPNKWDVYWVDDFKDHFLSYFFALEKNSEGYYRIIHSITENEIKDFKVKFVIKSILQHSISMPVVFKDIMREVITNARKYSFPGGKIDILLEMDAKVLKFSVRDNGIGIPSGEIDKVVDYKYRATNVAKNKMILGNGFGLTKAFINIKNLEGKLYIDSNPNKGTTVKIEIPIPDKEFVSANFGAMD